MLGFITLSIGLWLHGLLYLAILPPWDLIDEEHHLDYIHYLSTEGRPPVTGKDYLSQPITEALFVSQRWATYHWLTPSPQPRDWGLEGFSYEGYHPPLFYLLLSPFYRLMRGDALTQLYALRLILLCLSPLLLAFVLRFFHIITPTASLDATSWLLLIGWLLSTDRTMMMVRVNNDWLVWLLGLAFIWVTINAIYTSNALRILLWATLLLAAGLLTKLTFVLYVPAFLMLLWCLRAQYPTQRRWLIHSGLAIASVGSIGLSIALRNQLLYGSLTGVSAFMAIANFVPLPRTGESIAAITLSFIQTFWVTWWRGTESLGSGRWLIAAFDIINALILVSATLGYGRLLLGQTNDSCRWPRWLNGSFALLILLNLASTFFYVLNGLYPFNQARFLTVVDAPLLFMLNLGLRQLWPTRWRTGLLSVWLGLLMLCDLLYVLFYLMQYFYS